MSRGTLWNRGAVDSRNRPDTGVCNKYLEEGLRGACGVVCPTILFLAFGRCEARQVAFSDRVLGVKIWQR